MRDSYGRNIDYLRISITDRCNLRCLYCMPQGTQKVDMSEILTLEEMLLIAKAAAATGIRHIKVTGGEPLVRKGCCQFIRALKNVPGIETVTLTTNGILLEEHLQELVNAGIDAINISMDTRDKSLYQKITGGGDVSFVLSALEKVTQTGIPVKINVVSLDWTDIEKEYGEQIIQTGWKEMVEIARDNPVDVRFIELMPLGAGKRLKPLNHQELLEQMRAMYPQMQKDTAVHGFGPATYYQIPGFQGSIGFISALHEKFCDSCNRIRLTAQGALKTCLCYEAGVNLKEIIRSEGEEEKRYERLVAALKEAISEKPMEHCFENPVQITEKRDMSSIGG